MAKAVAKRALSDDEQKFLAQLLVVQESIAENATTINNLDEVCPQLSDPDIIQSLRDAACRLNERRDYYQWAICWVCWHWTQLYGIRSKEVDEMCDLLGIHPWSCRDYVWMFEKYFPCTAAARRFFQHNPPISRLALERQRKAFGSDDGNIVAGLSFKQHRIVANAPVGPRTVFLRRCVREHLTQHEMTAWKRENFPHEAGNRLAQARIARQQDRDKVVAKGLSERDTRSLRRILSTLCIEMHYRGHRALLAEFGATMTRYADLTDNEVGLLEEEKLDNWERNADE